MEKFVTDLDKLLDDFESENIESSNGDIHNEHYDYSEYNSLKMSTDLSVADTSLEVSTPTVLLSNDNQELLTPTTNNFPQIETAYSNEYFCKTSDSDIRDRSDYVECIMESITNSDTDIQPITNSAQPDKRRTGSEIDNDSVNDYVTLSPIHSQVPPRKKSRPNSLLGLTSVITSVPYDSHVNRITPIRPELLNICDETISTCSIAETTSVDNIIEECAHPEIVVDRSSPLLQDKDSQVSTNSIVSDQIESTDKAALVDDLNIWQGIPVNELGETEPTWIGDEISQNCMQCEMPFTMFRRRHHCRACGRLLCNKCCYWRMQLRFSSKLFPKDRVCAVCFQYLIRIEASRKHGPNSKNSTFQPLNSVLKSNRPTSLSISPNSMPSSNQSISDSIDASITLKSVMFADGIRPGGDLMESERSRIITPTRFLSRPQTKPIELNSPVRTSREPSLIEDKDSNYFSFQLKENSINNEISTEPNELTNLTTPACDSNCLSFAITKNLYVYLQTIRLPYCTCSMKNRVQSAECDCDYVECWYFASIGLETIGAEEIIIMLKRLPDEMVPPVEIFQYYFQMYQRAFRNETKTDNVEMTVELFSEKNINLKQWAGILHVRPSFQCLNKVPTPRSSFLIGILIHRWEFPWAMLLPLRLILALGNQSRFYPCSIVSDRSRPPVYGEVGQTILQVVSPIFMFPNNLERGVCDSSIVPTVPGMWLHLLATQETIVQIPKHSYQHLLDILSSRVHTNVSPLALAASFSRDADSHLVCCQNETTGQYYSRAISIQNTERMVTAATMIIFVPGNVSEEYGSSIVEDAIVVKLSQMHFGCVINSLKSMTDLALQCGSYGEDLVGKGLSSSPALCKSMVKIVWSDSRQMCDMASIERPSLVSAESVQSALDLLYDTGNRILKSYRVPSSLQSMTSDKGNQHPTNLKLVWTRFHLATVDDSITESNYDDPVDIESIIRDIAYNFANSIVPFLEMLHDIALVSIGLRTKISGDNVDWSVGCCKNYQFSCSPDQSPVDDQPDSRSNSYVSSKMRTMHKFRYHDVESLPEVCIDSINEVLVPFLYSKTALLRNGSLVAELEFHIID